MVTGPQPRNRTRAPRAWAWRLTAFILVACVAVTWTVAPAHAAFAEASSAAAGPSVAGSTVQASQPPVKVALIDTGIRRDRLREDAAIEAGRNYVFEDKDTTDVVGHGTRLAGILLDVAPGVTLVPLVYYSQYPSSVPANGGVSAICRAIYDAVDVYGCRVVNVSSGVIVEDEGLREAVRYAEEKGVIVVSAVGNDRITAPERVFFPAAYETVVGVGAVSADLDAAQFSQVNGSVTVVAPGKDLNVISIRSGSETETVSGTSYASAYVAAEAALLVTAYPDITPAEFRQVLKVSSQDLGDPGYDETFGWGYVDAGSGFSVLAYQRMLRVKALPFVDVSMFDWFCDAVLVVYENGLMLGESPDRFGPGRPVTWQMVATVLYRLHARYDTYDPTLCLDWFTGTGVADAIGGPAPELASSAEAASPITREALCAVLVEYCRYAGIQLSEEAAGADASAAFDDIEQANDWALGHMAIARAVGMMAGSGGLFRPADIASRAELATVLVRILSLYTRRPGEK